MIAKLAYYLEHIPSHFIDKAKRTHTRTEHFFNTVAPSK